MENRIERFESRTDKENKENQDHSYRAKSCDTRISLDRVFRNNFCCRVDQIKTPDSVDSFRSDQSIRRILATMRPRRSMPISKTSGVTHA